MVKETYCLNADLKLNLDVSIPSRGSGKGDFISAPAKAGAGPVSIPSRGSGKGDSTKIQSSEVLDLGFNPLSGKW